LEGEDEADDDSNTGGRLVVKVCRSTPELIEEPRLVEATPLEPGAPQDTETAPGPYPDLPSLFEAEELIEL